MHKYLVLGITIIIVSFLICGCGNGKTTEPPTMVSTTKITTTTTTITGITTATSSTPKSTVITRIIPSPTVTLSVTPEFPTQAENGLLPLILEYNAKEFTWLAGEPKILLGLDTIVYDNVSINGTKQFMRKHGYEIDALVDRLFALNLSNTIATMNLSDSGEVSIHPNYEYSSYFTPDGGGLSKFYNENQDVRTAFTITMPAYDPETGYVLYYFGWQGGPLVGSGEIRLLKFEDGELTELTAITLWVS